jgi:hypothetical protein
MNRPETLTSRLEKAMMAHRLGSRLTPEEYRMARTVDVELLMVLETLEKRVREVEAK